MLMGKPEKHLLYMTISSDDCHRVIRNINAEDQESPVWCAINIPLFLIWVAAIVPRWSEGKED